jgi:hypothetical protein
MDNIFTIEQLLERQRIYYTNTPPLRKPCKRMIWFYKKKLWETMNEKGFPTHLIRIVQSMYQNTAVIIRKNRVNNNTPIELKKEFITSDI